MKTNFSIFIDIFRKIGCSKLHAEKIWSYFDESEILEALQEIEESAAYVKISRELVTSNKLEMTIEDISQMFYVLWGLSYRDPFDIGGSLVKAVRFYDFPIKEYPDFIEIFETASGRTSLFTQEEKAQWFHDLSWEDQEKAIISLEDIEKFMQGKSNLKFGNDLIDIWSSYVGKANKPERQRNVIMEEIKKEGWKPLEIPKGKVEYLKQCYIEKYPKKEGTFRDRWKELRKQGLVDSVGNTLRKSTTKS